MTNLPIGLIVSTPGICGGKPRIVGYRITIQNIAVLYNAGWNVNTIAEELGITPGQVFAALSYYSDHKDEIDEAIRTADDRVREVMAKGGGLTFDEFKRRMEKRGK
jgi:uncharacterized protein (DUF433 family)